VSKGVLEGDTVWISGFNWCPGEPVPIGVNSATEGLLCIHHNGRLSETDAAAKETITAFREARRRSVELASLPPDPRTAKRWSISGGLLERWALKTSLNVCRSQGLDLTLKWIGNDADLADLPFHLVESAFGLRPITAPMGLYLHADVGSVLTEPDKIQVSLVNRSDGYLSGFYFSLDGQTFFMALTEEGVPASLSGPKG
jgi:hypothetical protein